MAGACSPTLLLGAAARGIPRRRGAGLGRLGRPLGVWVGLADREMAVDEAQPVAQPPADAAQHALGGDAVRTLKVAVHDEHERGVHRAGGVVAVADRRGSKTAPPPLLDPPPPAGAPPFF